MENKSCFNCTVSTKIPGYPDTWLEPGESDMAECSHMPDYDDLEDSTYEKIADKCKFYAPIIISKCEHCGKNMNSPLYSHEYWANLYDSIPVCSPECKIKAEESFLNDMKAAEEHRYDPPVTVLCGECHERIIEDEISIDNIEEGMQGEDIVTFVCPKCNKSTQSRRYG